MTEREVTARVVVAAPAGEVWTMLTDWTRHGEWMLGTRVWVGHGDGRSVGSRLFGFTGVLDVGFLDELEIVEWAPPHRCRVRHAGTLLRGSAEFVVEPSGAGAEVRWTERLKPPFGLVAPLLAWGMRRSLRRLAARRW